MKLTKEDYMRLPKERLAELLVEIQETTLTPPAPIQIPVCPYPATPWPNTPWYGMEHPITAYDALHFNTDDCKKHPDIHAE